MLQLVRVNPGGTIPVVVMGDMNTLSALDQPCHAAEQLFEFIVGPSVSSRSMESCSTVAVWFAVGSNDVQTMTSFVPLPRRRRRCSRQSF